MAGDKPRKVQFLELQQLSDLDLDLGSCQVILVRISSRGLRTHLEIGKTFCGRTERHTYERMDGQTT